MYDFADCIVEFHGIVTTSVLKVSCFPRVLYWTSLWWHVFMRHVVSRCN